MKRYIIFTFLFSLSFYVYASKVKEQSIIDYRIHLIEEKQNLLHRNIADHEIKLQNSIDKQNAFLEDNINRLDKNIDRWISILSIFLGLLSVYLVWKTEYSVTKLEKEVDRCKQIKEELESYRTESQEKLNKIRKIDQEVSNLHNKINKCFYSYAFSSTLQNQSVFRNNEISQLVSEINSVKTESQYTSNDWLLKGINAQLNKQYEDACFYYKKASEVNLNNDYRIYLNWGVALVQFCSSLNILSSSKDSILALFKCADSIQKGSADYNISCLYALLKDKKNFLYYLKKAIGENRELSRSYIEMEADFSAYYSDPDFIRTLDECFS